MIPVSDSSRPEEEHFAEKQPNQFQRPTNPYVRFSAFITIIAAKNQRCDSGFPCCFSHASSRDIVKFRFAVSCPPSPYSPSQVPRQVVAVRALPCPPVVVYKAHNAPPRLSSHDPTLLRSTLSIGLPACFCICTTPYPASSPHLSFCPRAPCLACR